MKKCTAMFLGLILSLLLSGCSHQSAVAITQTSENLEVAKLESMMKEVFNSYNSNNTKKINSMIKRFIRPDIFKSIFGLDGANNITIGNSNISLNDQSNRKFTFKIDDYAIDISGNTASIIGYISGSMSIQEKENQLGPWSMNLFMYENGDSWYIEHLSMKKFEIPKLEYYPQFPEAYGKDSNKKWPLIVFLHGSGEVGSNLDAIIKMPHSIPKIAATAKDFPFVTVSPLCPKSHSWLDLTYSVNNVVDEMLQKYNIDPDRIYLTGLSLGGYGTWGIARQYPERFAAIAPVCGTIDPTSAGRLKNIPIWAFHGDIDTTVTMDDEKKTIDILTSKGCDVKYTVYPGMGHEIWNRAYGTNELYDWFLQHKRTRK